MKSLVSFLALCASLLSIPSVTAQDDFVPESLIEPKTGIKFTAYPLEEHDSPEGSRVGTLGLVYPSDLKKNEYIGHLVAPRAGWVGLSHGGGMVKSLLMVLWLDGTTLRHSFRYATQYKDPYIYNKTVPFTELSKTLNATHMAVTYRCVGCFSWEYEDVKGNQTLDTTETVVMGWVTAKQRPNSPSNPDSVIPMHEGAGGVVPSDPKKVSSKDYDKYAAMKPIVDSTPAAPAQPKAQTSPKPGSKGISGQRSSSAAGPKTGPTTPKGKGA